MKIRSEFWTISLIFSVMWFQMVICVFPHLFVLPAFPFSKPEEKLGRLIIWVPGMWVFKKLIVVHVNRAVRKLVSSLGVISHNWGRKLRTDFFLTSHLKSTLYCFLNDYNMDNLEKPKTPLKWWKWKLVTHWSEWLLLHFKSLWKTQFQMIRKCQVL